MPFLLTFSPCEWVCVFKRTTPNPVRRLRGFCGRSSTFPHFVTEWMGLCCSVGRIESSLTKCNYYDQVEWECRRTDGRTDDRIWRAPGRVTMGIWGQIEIQKLPECNLLKWVFNISCRRRAKNMEFYNENSIKFPIYTERVIRSVAKWLLDRFNASPNSLNGHVE